jgi:hypothetical protein
MKHVPPPEGEPLSGLDNLAMAVSPKWGEAILRLAIATERVAAKLDELPDTIDAQYIAKVRELAKSLIDFLDGLEDTDHDTAIDDGPCDTDEREIAEGDDEPSLGSTRSRQRRAANNFHHSITSSARAKTIGGIVNPSALAVIRLMTSSTLVLCWIGKSAGLAPLRIFPT